MTFRKWVLDKWYEHLDELDSLSIPKPNDYTARVYFNMYKWWLWRQYQRELANGQSEKE